MMTVCPIAIAAGCKKCLVFRICPLKTVIGDYRPEVEKKAESKPSVAKAPKRAQRRKK
jgi:hypothetical protein